MDNRSADGAAELVFDSPRRFQDASGLVHVAPRVERVGIVEPEKTAVHVVGPALGGHVDDRSRGSAVFGRELIGDHPELLNGIRIVPLHLHAGNVGVINVLPVNREVVRTEPRAVHRIIGAVAESRIALIDLAHAGNRESETEHVAETATAQVAHTLGRQIRQAPPVKTYADLGVGCVHDGRVIGYRHSLRNPCRL